MWNCVLLRDIGLDRNRPRSVIIDNMSALQIVMNLVNHQQSKHIDIKFHWIQNMIMDHCVTPHGHGGVTGLFPEEDLT